MLARRLAAAGVPFRLLNAGVSGDTSAGGVRRVAWLLKQKPSIVVVELGANDGLRGLPVRSIEESLRQILARIRAADAQALLLGVRIPTSYGPEYGAAFEAIYPKLAAEFGVPFVPFFMEGVAGVPELNLEDGLHPTSAGHQRIAANVQPQLEQLLRKDQQTR